MGVVRSAAALAAMTILAACATPQARRDLSLGTEAKSGAVIASFPQFLSSKVFWKYRKLSAGENEDHQIEVTGRGPNAIVAGDRVLFALELTEGEYEFFGWSETVGTMTYWSPEPFSIRFRAVAGKATYIGSLELFRSFGKKSYSMGVKNLAAWDVPVFLRHYANVSASQVEVAIMHDRDDVVVPSATWSRRLRPR